MPIPTNQQRKYQQINITDIYENSKIINTNIAAACAANIKRASAITAVSTLSKTAGAPEGVFTTVIRQRKRVGADSS